MNIRVELEKVDVNPGRISRKISGNTKFWTYAATQWHRLYMPYVPMASGNLATNVRYGPGEIEHVAPYAHYQYTGEVYGPNYPIKEGGRIVGYYSPPGKHPTGRQLKHQGLASKEWDKKAEATQMPKLLSTLQAYIDRGGINFDE